jgi:hypothetical protein
MTNVIAGSALVAESFRRNLNVDNDDAPVIVDVPSDVRLLLMKLRQMLTSDDGRSLDYLLEITRREGIGLLSLDRQEQSLASSAAGVDSIA